MAYECVLVRLSSTYQACANASSRLSFGCLLLFLGRVGDIVGGRKMFLAGSLWFAIWYVLDILESA